MYVYKHMVDSDQIQDRVEGRDGTGGQEERNMCDERNMWGLKQDERNMCALGASGQEAHAHARALCQHAR